MDALNDQNPIKPCTLAKYSDLFERMQDPVLLVDPESLRILDHNMAALTFFDVSSEELTQSTFPNYVDAESKAELGKIIRIAKRSYYERSLKSWWNTKSGRRLMSVQISQLMLGPNETVLQILGRDITPLHEAELSTKNLLLQLQEANARLKLLSTRDEMTGLSNYRHFMAYLNTEHERAVRSGFTYSIIFIDVDHFKQYNDRNGHPAGDALLRELAEVLRRMARKVDLCARYGGEEFAIVTCSAQTEGVLIFAERVRLAISSHAFPEGQHQPLGKVTVSIGVASYPTHGDCPEVVLAASDQALYQSKRAGRDRITLAANAQGT